MLYNKDKKIKRNYEFLRTPASNKNLLKNRRNGQKVITKLVKNLG